MKGQMENCDKVFDVAYILHLSLKHIQDYLHCLIVIYNGLV